MAIEHYTNAVYVNLGDYIPADRFRTVLIKQLHIPGGLSEISVDIELSKDFARKLSFKVSGSGRIYGFVRQNTLLSELNSPVEGEPNIKHISLHDWDDKFLMLIETRSEPWELPFYVTPEEVHDLLENCLRVPEQK